MRELQRLEAGDDLTAKDMEDLQMDQVNLQAREFVPFFEETLENVVLTETGQQAMDALKQWDLKDDARDAEPLIFHTWMDEIETLLYQDEIPESMMALFEGSGQTTDELLRKGDDSIWMKENGGLEEVLRVALENTVDKLRYKKQIVMLTPF